MFITSKLIKFFAVEVGGFCMGRGFFVLAKGGWPMVTPTGDTFVVAARDLSFCI